MGIYESDLEVALDDTKRALRLVGYGRDLKPASRRVRDAVAAARDDCQDRCRYTALVASFSTATTAKPAPHRTRTAAAAVAAISSALSAQHVVAAVLCV